MLKITYTNGDIQNINVTDEFFTVTSGSKNGKPIKIQPLDKAEGLALDLAVNRKTEVSLVQVAYPSGDSSDDTGVVKIRTYKPVTKPEVEDHIPPGPSFIREMRRLKKEWRTKKPSQRWVWTF